MTCCHESVSPRREALAQQRHVTRDVDCTRKVEHASAMLLGPTDNSTKLRLDLRILNKHLAYTKATIFILEHQPKSVRDIDEQCTAPRCQYKGSLLAGESRQVKGNILGLFEKESLESLSVVLGWNSHTPSNSCDMPNASCKP